VRNAIGCRGLDESKSTVQYLDVLKCKLWFESVCLYRIYDCLFVYMCGVHICFLAHCIRFVSVCLYVSPLSLLVCITFVFIGLFVK